jgi:hypothetical protein
MRCTATTKSRLVCKRASCNGSDFCKQHNPLNTLDDTTCAICLEDIKNPLRAGSCRHIFCKPCMAETVFNTNSKCPCCRGNLSIHTIGECVKTVLGPLARDRFLLNMEMGVVTWKWGDRSRWTRTMEKRFYRCFVSDQHGTS